VVICLERGADLHMAQLMPLPLTVSCFSKIQIGFTFLVPAHPRSPGKRAVKWYVCVCVQGERLSHAVGCAFAICLEKKQAREKEKVTVTFSENGTSFTRMGSFRQTTLTERLADPQSAIVAGLFLSFFFLLLLYLAVLYRETGSIKLISNTPQRFCWELRFC